MEGWVFEKHQKSKEAQKCSQKYSDVFWTCFEATFPNFFAQCSLQGFPDFLDLKIWGQFSEIKKFEFGFPDLKFEVDTEKKLKNKIKKISKF